MLSGLKSLQPRHRLVTLHRLRPLLLRSPSCSACGRLYGTASVDKEDRRLSNRTVYTVDDIPTPRGSNWIQRALRILGNQGKLSKKKTETTFQSPRRKLYRSPIPFANNAATALVTSDPGHAAAVYRNEGESPVKPLGDSIACLLKKHGFGSGLLIDNWDTWKTLRSKSNKQIVPRRVLEFTPLIHEVAGDVVQHFKNSRGVNNYVDDVLSPLMDWSFEGMSVFVLGEKLELFTNPTPRMKKFLSAGVKFIQGFGPLFTTIPLYRVFPTFASISFIEAAHQLEEITTELMEEKIEKLTRTKISADEASGFLEQWLFDVKFTPSDIKVLMRDFLAAGIDTTSVAATNMLYELARNPHVQDKLREEVLSVVGEHEVPTVEHLQQLHYCKNVITETMRLHPIVPVNARALAEDIVLEDYLIPKGTWMFVANYTMSRDPSIFEDPLTFNPDRWTRESKKKKAFAYLPFGFGSRACYGRRLAELELNLLLIEMVRNFDLQTDLPDLDYAGRNILKPTIPVRIQFNDRK